MRAQHFYFDGCNGQQTGDHINGDLEDLTVFLLDQDTDSGEYDPEKGKEYQSLNGWTPEKAKQAVQEALNMKEVLYIDGGGDRQSWLSITED